MSESIHNPALRRRLTTIFIAFAALIALCAGDFSKHASAGLIGEKNSQSSEFENPSSLDGETRVSDLFGNTCQAHIDSQERGQSLSSAPLTSLGGDIQPIRKLEDPFPTFNGIAVDSANNLAMLSDSNRKSMLLYDRTSGDRSEKETKPLRQLIGPKTLLGYIAGLA